MTEDFGSGVTRTLSALQRQFGLVIWQGYKPPLDSELNLMAQITQDRVAQVVRSSMHSGFLLDPMDALRDFETDPAWSNYFNFGRAATGETSPILWANINGWLVPVTGTAVSEGDPSNRVDLWPPPTSDARIDLVFLEVWQAQVAPNPSTNNKPSASTIWKWGNVKYGGTNITDDIEDPDVGYETSERVQVQYRIRVYGSGSGLGSSVALDDYPDGLDDPNVLAQGTATAPLAGFSFTNMREALGDPGLWRAGDGDPTNDLGTTDGYSYAIPICAVFRRNSDPFVARETAGNANQNGAVNRNPITATITDPAAATKTFLTATLTNDIDETTTGDVQVANLVGSFIENGDINWADTFLVLDNEIISIESIDTGVSPATMRIRATGGRGRWGTMAVPHTSGTEIQMFNWRARDLFADQITAQDILDLRKGVTPGEWDYNSLLSHNLSKLFKGELFSSYKQSGIGDTQGPVVTEVDTLWATGTVPNQTEALDGPDGIRTVWSDGATLQSDVTMLLDEEGAGAVTKYDNNTEWEVGATFEPGGFNTGTGWQDGTSIFVYIGGPGGTGDNGARGTFRDGTTRAVRFLGPKEYWRQMREVEGSQEHPFTLRYLSQGATSPAAGTEPAAEHPGPQFPLEEFNFEKPFCVLGGILNSDSQISLGADVYNRGAQPLGQEVELTGFDFDTPGIWFSKDGSGNFENDPDEITKPLLYGGRTLYGMMTNNGLDRTGASSEVYVVIWGDTVNAVNNGLFRVVGAGAAAGYTTRSATNPNGLVVEKVDDGTWAGVGFTDEVNLNAELRSQYTHASDGGGYGSGISAICVVLTDLAGVSGGTTNPWNTGNLGALTLPQPIPDQMVMRTTLQYSPGRGGTARVPGALDRFSAVGAGTSYLRQSPSSLDATFPSAAGVPTNETYFPINSLQTWNRIASRGLTAPDALSYGGGPSAFGEEQREAEVFADVGSKTIMFRPYLDRAMTLYQWTVTAGQLIPTNYPPAHGGFAVDGAGIFQAGLDTGYEVAPEYMPRFGRQDIPFYVDTTGTGAGTFLVGINHLFTDSTSATEPQFNVLGGEDAPAGGVTSIRFQTWSGTGLAYGQWGTIPGSTTEGYQARLYSDPTVQSSDVGAGLNGIQLPPWLGIGRLYGVYERQDYEDAGGTTYNATRTALDAGAPPNLLRTDADKQTLYIVQGGAEDVTGDAGDHTYVIPENAIDLSLSNYYTPGDTFDSHDYVVECVVFGFARGWINDNNYVLARLNNGSGAAADAILAGARQTLPAAALISDECYACYDRPVYQGDPYMTRAGATRTVSDYEHRYGQIDVSDAFDATPAIQQYDSNGNFVPQTINERAVEVLAAMDFWTTLGTGKIGGSVVAGTSLDVAVTQENQDFGPCTRLPAASSSEPFQVGSRAFTEGQKTTLSRDSAIVAIDDNASIAPGDSVSIQTPEGTVTLATPADWAVGADGIATASNIAAAINQNASLARWVRARSNGQEVTVAAREGGDSNNSLFLVISNTATMSIQVPRPQAMYPGVMTGSNLIEGVDRAMNATIQDMLVVAAGATTPVSLTGLTERLPMGLLLQDSDFLGEDPLRDGSSFLRAFGGAISADTTTPAPLSGGEEYTRVVGGVGTTLGMSDGAILQYTPYNDVSSPTGSRRFRLYRGGGSLYVVSGLVPGGPVDWALGGFDFNTDVLKGAILVGRAYLVRNFPETAFTGSEVTSHGDEIQMVIATKGVLGRGSPAFRQEDATSAKAFLAGSISPTGYGEGYAAADRYRLEGKPLYAGHSRKAPDLDPSLGVFPFTSIAANAGVPEE